MLKVLTFSQRKAGASRAEFERYWRDVHVPMWESVPGIRGYVISTIAGGRLQADPPELAMGDIDGVVELWYDGEDAMARSAGSPAGQAWRADSALFIGAMRSFLTVEQALVPQRPGTRAPIKELSIMVRRPGTEPGVLESFRRQARAPTAGALPGLESLVISHPLRELKRIDIPPIAMDGAPTAFAAIGFASLAARERTRAMPQANRGLADDPAMTVRTLVLAEQVVLAPPAAPTDAPA